MILCAGDSERFPFAVPIGVGMVRSAINLTRAVLMSPPEYLLFVGTAGSYGRKEIFEIVESKTAANVEQSLLIGSAYTPIENVISAAEDVSRETIVNSSNYITSDERMAERFLAKRLELENMEFFSVMAVAKEFDIPAGGVFCVTNYCNQKAHEDFLRNQSKAMDLLEEYLQKKGVLGKG
ncbi:5'-methylthioadenosine/S-adenosylhomocysteine nucleosidase family protein [Nitratifractor sp.]